MPRVHRAVLCPLSALTAALVGGADAGNKLAASSVCEFSCSCCRSLQQPPGSVVIEYPDTALAARQHSVPDAGSSSFPAAATQATAAVGSLRHSYSCPPIRQDAAAGSISSKAAPSAAQRPPTGLLRGQMVRMSDSHLQLSPAPANGGLDAAAERAASAASSHELLPDEGDASWGSIQAYSQNSQQQLAAGSNGSTLLAAAANGHSGTNGYAASNGHQQQRHDELERRKFTRNLLSANNKKESLERYKAIMSLIEACKRRLEQQLGPAAAAAVLAAAAWDQEPLVSLLQSVLDVGEALASFGNCHFPEHSNEARAILAGDYRALLRQYLSTFGFAFAQPTKQQLTHDMQEEVQCVGSLLATRCDAYDLLYDQLVRHVGLEGRGGPSTLIVNHNNASAAPNTSITANPTNTTSAAATSKSKLHNSGLGAAAIAAAGLVGLLLLRGMRGAAHRRGRRGSSGSSHGSGDSSNQQQQRPLRVPKGKNGRELLLVSQLTGCADELRKARQNEELLKDDWRLGRHVRLAWPPGPPLPAGYADGAPDACNVGLLLQEMYG